MKKVLVVWQRPDPHIDSVLNFLRELDTTILFFDLFSPDLTTISLDIDKNKADVLMSQDNTSLSDIDSVWWRVKPYYIRGSLKRKGKAVSEFLHREWRSLLESLEFFTGNARWVNPRMADLRARNKPAQLLMAKQIGFHIPDTLISNDPVLAFNFLNRHESIFKVLTWYFEYPDKAIFTSKITNNHIKSDLQSVRLTPGIFQQRIEKSYELRVTVAGCEIFCVKIDSQANEYTLLDWRRDQCNVNYFAHSLPSNIENLILKMNERLGLLYATYDLIVTPTGQYVFLEVNPTGQWLWLEEKTGVPISRSIARLLTS
jgi:hypothetical protein